MFVCYSESNQGRQVLKEQGLNPADASCCRPISNLSVVSKLLERLVAQQLQHYLCTLWLDQGGPCLQT